MKETLYRRNADGVMETVVPEARGKAAAFDHWLAQGGTPFRVSGKFKQGPMKGMTYDQAKQKFEGMWASSPDAIKEKYASRSATDMAPSERKIAGIEPTPPKDMSPVAIQKRRMASYGHELDANGNAVPIGAKTSTTPAPKSFAPGSDEARAAALTQNSRNERFATASWGNGVDMASATAMGNDWEAAANKRDKEENAPFEGADFDTSAIRRELEAKNAAERERIQIEQADARNADTAAKQQALREKLGLVPVAGQSLATPPPAPFVGPPRSAMPAPELNGSRIGTPSRINPLTKLPFGYQPGDSVAPDQADAAGDSIRRQEQAQNAAFANAPRAVPVIAPTPLRDQHTAAVADYQKDLDPAKFAKVNAVYNSGTDLEKAQMAGDTLKRSAPLARRDSALAAAARKPLTVATRPQFARR